MKAIISAAPQKSFWQFFQCTWIPWVPTGIWETLLLSQSQRMVPNSSLMQMHADFHILLTDNSNCSFIHGKWMWWQLKRLLCISQSQCVRSSNVGVIKESDGAAAVSKPQICLAEELSKLHFTLWLQCATSALYRICSLVGWVLFPVSILISSRVNREHRPTQLPPGSSQAVLLTVALTAREH